ncbi:MAG TPA: hypothetical protein VG652_01465 [Gaiellaceae bacterium]|nr:hypothetical protein [Gaiellaceae bacterium]
MPTRKQRRRKAKTFRHEFDFVTTDEEGNEVVVDAAELRVSKEKDKPKGKKPQSKGRSSRATREVAPPSWERALKRGGLMGGFLLIVMVLFLKSPLLLGGIYGLAMIPMTYWIDRFAYRNYLRKQEKS